MALSYTSVGYLPTTSYQLVRKAWNTTLHEEVQNKSFFKNMIGKDKGGEGSLDKSITNFPIVEKTDLRKAPGDNITIGLLRALWYGGPGDTASYNRGKVSSQQLVDNEDSLVFHHVQVKLAHQRDAVVIGNAFETEQRSPYDLRKAAQSALSSSLAKILDDGTFFALYARYSPNVFRSLGESVAVPAQKNQIFGNDRSALTGLTSNDKFGAEIIDRVASWVMTNNIAPINGDKHIIIVHPNDWYHARRDSSFVDGLLEADVRGDENRIFTGALGKWAGLEIMVSNKITTCLNFDALTVSSNTITLSAETSLPAGITAAQIRMPLVIGANAVARGYGKESYMVRRKEDDYENMVGFGGGMVYGDARTDWVVDDGTGATSVNQSSACLYTYSPGAVSNGPTTWS